MIKDLSTRDIIALRNGFISWLYNKSLKHFQAMVFSIAERNQQIQQSTVFTFTYGGEVFRFDSAEIRFPQTLDPSLRPEMYELLKRKRAITDIEGAYALQAFIAACGIAESVSHLYQLLPELVHPYLSLVGVTRELGNSFTPLPEKVVMEFKVKHEKNLDMIAQRASRNTLGLIK